MHIRHAYCTSYACIYNIDMFICLHIQAQWQIQLDFVTMNYLAITHFFISLSLAS